jgi:hypothetical protein
MSAIPVSPRCPLSRSSRLSSHPSLSGSFILKWRLGLTCLHLVYNFPLPPPSSPSLTLALPSCLPQQLCGAFLLTPGPSFLIPSSLSILVSDTRPRSLACSYPQLCNSTVEDEASPSMYITYNDSQQYPEYLITFKK